MKFTKFDIAVDKQVACKLPGIDRSLVRMELILLKYQHFKQNEVSVNVFLLPE